MKEIKKIKLSYFGNIEDLSSIFMAFIIYPNTKIIPFTKDDILNAVVNNQTDSRNFQSSEVELELCELLNDLSKKGISDLKKDEILKARARKYYIERTAFLVLNPSTNPILLYPNYKVKDGSHRIMAAIARNEMEILYKIES